MNKFKIGDKVRLLASTAYYNKDLYDRIGKVIRIEGDVIGISYPNWSYGHSCDRGNGDKSCWWLDEYMIEKIPYGRKPSKKTLICRKIKEIAERRKKLGYRW